MGFSVYWAKYKAYAHMKFLNQRGNWFDRYQYQRKKRAKIEKNRNAMWKHIAGGHKRISNIKSKLFLFFIMIKSKLMLIYNQNINNKINAHNQKKYKAGNTKNKSKKHKHKSKQVLFLSHWNKLPKK